MSDRLFQNTDGLTLTDLVAALEGTTLPVTVVETLYRFVRNRRGICVSYRTLFKELEANGYVRPIKPIPTAMRPWLETPRRPCSADSRSTEPRTRLWRTSTGYETGFGVGFGAIQDKTLCY